MNIAMGADHGGFSLKESLKEWLRDKGYVITDLGTNSADSVDYPDYAGPAASAVLSGSADRGILICGSGIGMSIAANRFPGIRAALCLDPEMARLSRQHNDSNILVMAGRKTGTEAARAIVDAWLAADFEGDRHVRRLQKIDSLVTPI